MKANFQLLTRILLLVATNVVLLFSAPHVSASIDFSQHPHSTQQALQQSQQQPQQPLLQQPPLQSPHKKPLEQQHSPPATKHGLPVDTTRYFRLRLKNGSVAHVVVVDMPSGHWILRTVVNAHPLNVARTALNYGAGIAVNGGFFDLRSGKSVSYISDQGRSVADPHDANNSFSTAILNRSELRQIADASGALRLAVVRHSQSTIEGEHVREALQAGPALLPSYDPVAEGFIRKTRRGGMVDAISTASPEARTAIGITSDGKLIIVCVETPGRKPDGHGATLKQLTSVLKSLGAVQALNLDGGTSTTMFLRLPNSASFAHGKVVCGSSSMRAVKSVLLLQYVR